MNHAVDARSASDHALPRSETQPYPTNDGESPLAFKVRLFAVDDNAVVLRGLQVLINMQPDMVVCGVAEGLTTAKRGIDEVKPDLAIVDLGLVDGDGYELTDWIRSAYPYIKVLIFTSQEMAASAKRAFQCGAHGYVAKSDGTRELIRAIRLVVQNQRFLSSRLSQKADLE